MQSRADLHVHSKFSNRPSEWLLRRIGAPECFVEPHDLYRRALERGMDFVTITDHNTIDGALEIAACDNVFVSAEVTTYFPEDSCKVHVLVHDITEAQFRDISDVRDNIFDLSAYLVNEGILHACAHPLFAVNEKLTLAHVEQMLLLFKRFEVLNGTRYRRANALMDAILKVLDPEVIAELADTHRIEPVGPEPWVKFRTGGSDDHSGVYAASAHTCTPHATNVQAFLAAVRAGHHEPGGRSGTSLRLAHSFYRIGYDYYRKRLLDNGKASSVLLTTLLKRMAGENSAARAPEGLLKRTVKRIVKPWKKRRLSPIERTLVDEFSALMARKEDTEQNRAPIAKSADLETFELASSICHHVGYYFLSTFIEQVRQMSLLESLQSFASLAPAALSMAPYIAAFKTQHKDDAVLHAVTGRFGLASSPACARARKAWVTDTFSDVNGVAKTIRTLSSLARASGRDLTVVTCLDEDLAVEADLEVMNVPPIGMFDVPEYSQQRIAFPPFLDVIEYLEREQFTEVVISTPGPLGLTALAAARLLGLRATGIYHTDFPKYVEILTEDTSMAQITWRYMCWFYGQMDLILAPSEWYRRHLRENGLSHCRIDVLPRGVDTEQFSPDKRDPAHWQAFGSNGNFKFLYVGRLSREKNIDVLMASFDELVSRGHKADLVLVGDGPMMGELRRRYHRRDDVVLTGFLSGEPLARSYASSDVFVFPSLTDTFGNVVLEAQASGLPAIVSASGGPPEIVSRHDSGIIVDMTSSERLADAMEQLCTDTHLRQVLAERALDNARERTWSAILEHFWETGETPAPVPTAAASR